MMPKFTSFAFRRISRVTPLASTPKTFAAVVAWMSSLFVNASTSPGSPLHVRHDAKLDLRVVGGEKLHALGRNERGTDGAPDLVRMGMFCRFGSLDERSSRGATV